MEKTVLINCSPKRKLSVSGFLMRCAGILIRGGKEYLQIRTPPIIRQRCRHCGQPGRWFLPYRSMWTVFLHISCPS